MTTSINETILLCEIITNVANRLTEYRLSNNPSLDEMIKEIPRTVKGAISGVNPQLENEIIEYFETLLNR